MPQPDEFPAPMDPASTGDPGQLSADPRRDPGSPPTAVVAWLATIVAVVIVVMVQAKGRNAPPPLVTATSAIEQPDALINLMGRYVVGAGAFAKSVKPGAATAPPASPPDSGAPAIPAPPPEAAQLLAPLDGFAADPADSLRVAIVAGEIVGPDAARLRLDKISEKDPLPEALQSDIATLRAIYAGERDALTDKSKTDLRERHAWFGRLALSYGAPDTDPERSAVLAAATRTMGVLLVAVIGAGVMSLVGVAVAVWAVILISQRKIRPAYAPPTPGGSAYLEAFAIFLLGFLAMSKVAHLIEDRFHVDATFGLVWLLALCPFYPLLRGVPWRKHRYAVGLHAGAPLRGMPPHAGLGRRIFREMGAGLMGYLAGLPIFILGILLTLLTAFLVGILSGKGEGGAPPSHPIIREIGSGGLKGALMILLLASVWAPLVEESMFRGCFYHHLRGRLRPIVAGVGVAFVFAIIHPPGIIAVPALMSLAIVFALIREWRGSLIGCMTAHALHNGTLLLTLMLAIS